jgi:hypothetical protein
MVHYASRYSRPQSAAKAATERRRFRWGLVPLIAAASCVTALLAGTPAAAALPTRGLFVNADKPSVTAVASKRSVNLGVKFTSSVSGKITALQFYRGPKQHKAYAGSLWSAGGKLLGRVSFHSSTKVGWQTAKLKKAVSIKANTTYLASYLASGGRYPVSTGAFTSGFSHDGITVPSKGGLYYFGSKSHRPTHTTASNYFVDVVLAPSSVSALITDAELQAAATKRVYFGHQSVGWNVVDGVGDLYSAHGMSAPETDFIASADELAAGTGGVFAHGEVGVNEHPVKKLAAFDAIMRAGLAEKVNVALVKFCFVDIPGETSVDDLFADYQTVIGGLERDYPGVTFLYATDPLTTEIDSSNVERTKFNNLVRAAYGTSGRLWDIAAVESTKPDGSRVKGTVGGQAYEALYSGYSLDGGHLNTAGRDAAAAALLRLIGQAG